MINYGDWLPDKPTIYGPHLIQAKNVIPTPDGYAPFKAFSTASGALNGGTVRGAGAFRDEVNTVHVYAGTVATLEELLADATWDDVSGAVYTSAITTRWQFCQFGGAVLATNFDNPIQTKAMSGGSNFANLGG